MTENPRLKIMIRDHRIVSLNELYEEYHQTHTEQASLSFEQKINALVELQKIALTWGGKKEVIVWKTGT